MDSISIKVPVTVKAKLTEKLRAKMLKEMEEGLSRAELELQQLGIQEKRVMHAAGDPAHQHDPSGASAPR